jgi:cell division protein FtsQ
VTRRRNRIRQHEIHLLHATTRKKHSRRQIAKWCLMVGVVLVSITAAAVGTHFAMNAFLDKALRKNPQYALREISVESKGEYSQRQILRAAGLQLGENIWTINLDLVRARIEKLPFVSEARIEKHLPSKLVIRIKERTPILQLKAYDSELGAPEIFYVDREACVLFKPRPGENKPLPVVINLKAAEFAVGQSLRGTEVGFAVDLLKRLEVSPLGSRFDIREIDVGQPLALRVLTKDGAEIYFRLDYLHQQLQRLQEIYEYARIKDQRIQSVDLTLDRNVPVRFLQ